MKNLLNLKEKNPFNIVVVEKIVPKKISWHFEVFSLVAIIAISSGILFKISHADNVTITSNNTPIGIYGTVTSISNNSLFLDDSHGSKHKGVDLFNVDLSNVSQIETSSNNPTPLSLSDINVGDKIIAKGTISGSDLYAQNIISFSATSSKVVIDVATSTATSTATTTEEATTTSTSTISPEVSTSTATTTEEITTTPTSTIDLIDSTSTPQTPETSISTTTLEVSTSTATSTDIVSSITTSEDSSSTSTDTDVISTTTPPLSYLIDLSNQTASAFDAVKYILGQMLRNINFFKLFNK